MKEENLADKIASILNTTPSNFDPEDDNNPDNTKAIVNYENVEENDEHVPFQSQIRKQNIDLLADIDERYVGKKGSRKNLNSQEETTSDESSIENDQENATDNENEEESSEEESFSTEDDSKESDSYLEHTDEEKEQINFKTLNDDVSQQVKKGRSVKNQMTIWESLLEIRIQMQKCLTAANKMPQLENYKEIKNESGQEFSNSVQQTKNSITSVLDKFLFLQNLLWKQCPEVKKLGEKIDDDNEEIPSDTDEELIVEEETEEGPLKKKMKLIDYEKDIQEKHDSFKEYRNSVIQKWHDKTRLPSMKNNTSHSIINHIEHTLTDKSKLIKRTQLKKTDYTIIGEKSLESNEQEYNSEIFDDNDFYHQLLRELIEVKSADLTDPVQLGRQWIQLQNLRSKMKRKIDTRATKGRKIRYAVHTKLVNFMAPIDNNLLTDEAKTELFGSLFGKKQTLVS